MKEVVLTPSAQAELDGATEWYEVRAGGIGLKFVSCVDEALQQIGNSPSVFPRWEHDQRFRKFVLQRFPYIVFYREFDDRVEVIAVAHGAREPGYWRNRT
jgi:toxin ParE1/3/4